MEIFCDVITRYMKMGAGQFLRDFRRTITSAKGWLIANLLFRRKNERNIK